MPPPRNSSVSYLPMRIRFTSHRRFYLFYSAEIQSLLKCQMLAEKRHRFRLNPLGDAAGVRALVGLERVRDAVRAQDLIERAAGRRNLRVLCAGVECDGSQAANCGNVLVDH